MKAWGRCYSGTGSNFLLYGEDEIRFLGTDGTRLALLPATSYPDLAVIGEGGSPRWTLEKRSGGSDAFVAYGNKIDLGGSRKV